MDKKLFEDYLAEVDYSDTTYVPSEYALKFASFIAMVNGGTPENKTPIVHLKLFDSIFDKKRNSAVVCARGMAKSSVLEYLALYIMGFGEMPNGEKINFLMYISDSIENGVKSFRKNIEHRYNNSDFLQKLIPMGNIKYFDGEATPGARFTDVRIETVNMRGNNVAIRMFGVKALSLDTRLYTETGYTTIGKCKIGDKIFGADGKLTTIIAKSEVFEKQMYEIVLKDGRKLKVSEDHINPVVIKKRSSLGSWVEYEDNLQTFELLKYPIFKTLKGYNKVKGFHYEYNKELMFVKNIKPIEYTKKSLDIDPYTLGLLLGDGRLREYSGCITCELTAHKDDWSFYKKIIPYEHGTERIDKRNNNVVTTSIKGIANSIRTLNIACKGSNKFIPDKYFFGSIEQRLDLLQGLMDSDGSISKDRGSCYYSTTSPILAKDIQRLVWSLGGKATLVEKTYSTRKTSYYIVHIRINLPVFKLPRKLERQRYSREEFTAVVSINKIPLEKSQCIAVSNAEHQFIAGEYFRTHNTGVRGTKEFGKRPQLALIDDVLSDEDARSETVIKSINDTIHKAVRYALDPKKNKMIWVGTPFNSRDPLYTVVESGAWNVSMFPICEKFPCEREEFRGAWEDRFDYDFVKSAYENALALGQIDSFNQELMLRIISSEDTLIPLDSLVYFSRTEVVKNKGRYNFYITTDLATSVKKAADYSVISVWAYSNNGDYMLVDGWCQRVEVSEFINMLFRYVSIYNPLGVGVEVTGQQGGFISWIREEMIKRNIYFNFLSSNNDNNDGIRPVKDKFERFVLFKPRFVAKKVWIAEEMKESTWYKEFIEEISKATIKGFKAKHDDILDTISMLGSFEAYAPSGGSSNTSKYLQEVPKIKNTIF